MNKYLMLTAAALLATSPAAPSQAGTFSVHFGGYSGSSYCNGVMGVSNNIFYYATLVYAPCDTGPNIGSLALGSTGSPPKNGKKKKGQVGFLDTSMSHNGVLILQDLQTPIKAGGHWAAWACVSSASCFIINQGILLPGQYNKGSGKSAPSSVAKAIETLTKRGVK